MVLWDAVSTRNIAIDAGPRVTYPPRVKLATWNVNSIKARLPFVVGWLRERHPDVVCVQELKLADDDFPHDAFAEAGFHCAVHGQPQWNGVAVLSRRPAEVVQRGLPGADELALRRSIISEQLGRDTEALTFAQLAADAAPGRREVMMRVQELATRIGDLETALDAARKTAAQPAALSLSPQAQARMAQAGGAVPAAAGEQLDDEPDH